MHNEEHGTEVVLPHLAESLASATVGKWLKQPGDYVQEYEVLCELVTDKVSVEMPSPFEGTVVRILVEEGDAADVGAPICIIREPGAQEEEAPETASVPEDKVKGETDYSTRYSPAVLHLAEEHGVDLRKVKGTSLGGRINRKDVLAYVMNRGASESKSVRAPERNSASSAVSSTLAEAAPPVSHQMISAPTAASSGDTGDQYLPVTPVRKMIAQRMHQSVSEIPHAWLMIEADVSRLVALREKLKERFAEKEGVKLTVTPFVLKAVVNAIKDYPILNSTWAEDHIVIKKEINVSIAVGSDDSVVTPVIRNADRKTIAGLALEMDDVTKRARSGILTLSDMQGGTFTFNNTGSFGSILSFPIINHPQAAIITLEAIVRKPVVIGQDMIAIRSMANLCLSLDHRILDGKICGLFIQRVKHYLEQYSLETVIY